MECLRKLELKDLQWWRIVDLRSRCTLSHGHDFEPPRALRFSGVSKVALFHRESTPCTQINWLLLFYSYFRG